MHRGAGSAAAWRPSRSRACGSHGSGDLAPPPGGSTHAAGRAFLRMIRRLRRRAFCPRRPGPAPGVDRPRGRPRAPGRSDGLRTRGRWRPGKVRQSFWSCPGPGSLPGGSVLTFPPPVAGLLRLLRTSPAFLSLPQVHHVDMGIGKAGQHGPTLEVDLPGRRGRLHSASLPRATTRLRTATAVAEPGRVQGDDVAAGEQQIGRALGADGRSAAGRSDGETGSRITVKPSAPRASGCCCARSGQHARAGPGRPASGSRLAGSSLHFE